MSRMMWLTVVLVAIATGPAFADSMHFNSGGSVTWINAVTGEDVYISPYNATDQTSPGWTDSIYCLDYLHPIAPPNDWTADILNVNATNDPSFKLTASLTTYDEAVWLFQQQEPLATSNPLYTEYQIAAWYLFDPNMFGVGAPSGTAIWKTGGTTGTTLATLGDIQALITGPSGASVGITNLLFTTSGWSVVNPTTPYPLVNGVRTEPQEFLVHRGGSDNGSVPEPASILLLGIVLVGCGRGLARRWS